MPQTFDLVIRDAAPLLFSHACMERIDINTFVWDGKAPQGRAGRGAFLTCTLPDAARPRVRASA